MESRAAARVGPLKKKKRKYHKIQIPMNGMDTVEAREIPIQITVCMGLSIRSTDMTCAVPFYCVIFRAFPICFDG
jgi:hypothetical protein